MAQDSGTEVSMTATALREQAALARRLVRGLSGEADRRSLRELADQLESEAAALDEDNGRAPG